jgi:hypothetical protein
MAEVGGFLPFRFQPRIEEIGRSPFGKIGPEAAGPVWSGVQDISPFVNGS